LKVEYNISRLNYLLGLFKMPLHELLQIISKGLKKPVTEQELYTHEIKLSLLKKIDKVFNKGIHFYLDPKSPEFSKDASIFFRKEHFSADLNISAKKIVSHFEDFKISLSALAALADIDQQRRIPVYRITDDPQKVAALVRKELYPAYSTVLKEFLRALITKFAEKNILVFEFIETAQKKDKVNIDGFFLQPNVIVLKRQQHSFRREIFTIVHELGHFLLNEEEIESLDYQTLAKTNLSSIENWCNNFAFHFLIGDLIGRFEKLDTADSSNDYHHTEIEYIYRKTHLSKIALYTRLLYQKKLSQRNYDNIRREQEAIYNARIAEEKRIRELEKQDGSNKQKGSAPRPINSPLLVSTIQTAFYEGIINEYDVCKRLNINPKNLDKYIQ